MCGFAGIVGPGGSVDAVVPMLDAQSHRGPDGAHVWSGQGCVLGHRRLAIIDLTDAADQPMTNESGSVRVVFNGEIYNFGALRLELEKRGHEFVSAGDTEVIVHGYEEWGPEVVQRLRGMFAAAVWDSERRRLVLFRDRVGKKPLVYWHGPTQFLFASEIRGLVAHPDVPRRVDRRAIDAYLSWGYVPAPHTGFEGIAKLAPGSLMVVDGDRPERPVDPQRYWRLDFTPKLGVTPDDAGAMLREELTEAVRLRLRSDVPLGAFLSGGIDSSIVVGLMAQLSDRPVETFSIGFDERSYDELPFARQVAQRWSTEHHEEVVKPDAVSLVHKLARHYGEPFADSSALPTYLVSEATRRHVTVALTGDGGDESFAGYERYWANLMADRIGSVPGLATVGRTLGRALPDTADPKNRLRRARRFLEYAGKRQVDRYAHWVGFFDEEVKAGLYDEAMLSARALPTPVAWMGRLFEDAAGLDPAEACMAVDIRSYLPYDLLAKVDIASMANSLEARSPFLDHAVMELAARMPRRYKLAGRQHKRILKETFRDLLPESVLRRSKMGFGVPVGQWMRGPLRQLVEDALLGPELGGRGYFRTEVVERMWRDHLAGRAELTPQLWSLFMLEMWHRELEVSA
ncbi:MAG TPA: asparagine synthase (glutamine-hydrolyzing) [Acidimicrobiales bacterium]|nr:asparagine synthase (glutamine-hydrolyzing) [Acidimicrobiales bacterium]